MSVAPLTTQELGCFVAICYKHLQGVCLEVPPGVPQLKRLCELAELCSAGNAGAYLAQYGEALEPASAAEIEDMALEYLAGVRDMTADHFGPLAYNMIANDGTAYTAPGVEVRQASFALDQLRAWEHDAHKWQDAKQAELQRAEENAEAYNDVGRLRTMDRDAILAKMVACGASRVIIAQFNVNESDMRTDYHGGRTARRVVIGYGKGKRESFKQLRAAAARFKPTADMGPGCDQFRARLVWDHNKNDDPGRAFIGFGKEWDCNEPQKGHGVVLHYYKDHYCDESGKPLDDAEEHRWGFGFNTRAACEAWIAAHPPLRGMEWSIEVESYENRENYSMGGGNYLGASRYGGWKVFSTSGRGVPERCEVLE